jgi:hypothetical protein
MDSYRFDRNHNLIEEGRCEMNAAIRLFEQCCQNGMKHYERGEEAIAATSFGLSNSKADFIEITCNGQDCVTVHSDRLHFPSRLIKAFSLKKHFFIDGSRSVGLGVIQDYFKMDRQEFETKYHDFLCR